MEPTQSLFFQFVSYFQKTSKVFIVLSVIDKPDKLSVIKMLTRHMTDKQYRNPQESSSLSDDVKIVRRTADSIFTQYCMVTSSKQSCYSFDIVEKHIPSSFNIRW